MSLAAHDRQVIIDLAIRSFAALDEGNIRAWTECFAQSGTLVVSRKVAEQVRCVGPAQLAEFVSRHAASGQARWWTNNPLIEGSANEVRLRIDVATFTCGALPIVIATGVCTDHLIRLGTTWLISTRRLTLDEA